jgi:hypothetical protein
LHGNFPRRHLPVGVALLAFLIGLVGLFYVIFGIALAFADVLFAPLFPHLVGTGLVSALALFLLGLLLLIVAIGLWRLRLWALVLSILVFGFLWLSEVLSGGFLRVVALLLLLLLVYLIAVHREFR